jgi:hypothetical protein
MSKSFIFIFILILTTCDNENEIQDYPDCMQEVIDNYLNNYPISGSKPATISKYKYKNQELYIFDPGSGFADWLFSAVNKNCIVVCEFGGIAGIQTCSDWDSEAKFIKIVWKDKR